MTGGRQYADVTAGGSIMPLPPGCAAIACLGENFPADLDLVREAADEDTSWRVTRVRTVRGSGVSNGAETPGPLFRVSESRTSTAWTDLSDAYINLDV